MTFNLYRNSWEKIFLIEQINNEVYFYGVDQPSAERCETASAGSVGPTCLVGPPSRAQQHQPRCQHRVTDPLTAISGLRFASSGAEKRIHRYEPRAEEPTTLRLRFAPVVDPPIEGGRPDRSRPPPCSTTPTTAWGAEAVAAVGARRRPRRRPGGRPGSTAAEAGRGSSGGAASGRRAGPGPSRSGWYGCFSPSSSGDRRSSCSRRCCTYPPCSSIWALSPSTAGCASSPARLLAPSTGALDCTSGSVPTWMPITPPTG